MKCLLPALVLLLLPHVVVAETYAPVWDFTASVAGDSVELSLTNRYVACGMGARIDRVAGADRTNVFEGTDGLGLETVDQYVDCLCEPLGTSFGTGAKNCPEQACTKDEQCACSRLCATTLDACPPPGEWTYELFDLDGNLVATTSVTVADVLPGCTATVVEPAPEAPEPEGDSGCSEGRPTVGALFALLALVLLYLMRRGRPTLFVLFLALAVQPSCGEEEKPTPAKAEPAPKVEAPLTPVDAGFEETPWEVVVAAQAEFLDFFETSGDPAATVRDVNRWRRDRLPTFKEECQAALNWYAEDSVHRMDTYVKAGRAWSVVKQRVTRIAADWGPAEKHDVGTWVQDFECR